MRSKESLQELFNYDTSSSVKIVQEYVKKYESLTVRQKVWFREIDHSI